MESHQLVGLILILVGVLDGIMSTTVPKRIPDERQRQVVRYALLGSGAVAVVLGALFFAGVFE